MAKMKLQTTNISYNLSQKGQKKALQLNLIATKKQAFTLETDNEALISLALIDTNGTLNLNVPTWMFFDHVEKVTLVYGFDLDSPVVTAQDICNHIQDSLVAAREKESKWAIQKNEMFRQRIQRELTHGGFHTKYETPSWADKDTKSWILLHTTTLEALCKQKEDERRLKRALREQKEASYQQYKATWIASYGSDTLKESIALGYPSDKRYAAERLEATVPGAVLDYDYNAEYEAVADPSRAAVQTLKSLPESFNPSIVWLTVDWENEPLDKWDKRKLPHCSREIIQFTFLEEHRAFLETNRV